MFSAFFLSEKLHLVSRPGLYQTDVRTILMTLVEQSYLIEMLYVFKKSGTSQTF